MRTRALDFIPGGPTLSRLYERLMEIEGIRRLGIPELALGMFDRIGRALDGEEVGERVRKHDREARR